MSGVLRETLIVRNPDTFETVALVAGSEVPDWATKLVHADDLEPADSSSGRRTGQKSK